MVLLMFLLCVPGACIPGTGSQSPCAFVTCVQSKQDAEGYIFGEIFVTY